jgi:predicted ATPase/predicted negative regulator of RcsB-dependent stress response
VTLKGAPGIGKSRLSRQAAAAWNAVSGGQVWFCDLTNAATVDGLVLAVSRTLDVSLGREDAVEHLGHAMRGRGDMVLVLDNFEQMVDSAYVLTRWRQMAPRTRFLVTSRVALGLGAEMVIELAPLSTFDAAALLVARARQRGVEVAGDPRLAELAERLQGVPLALELAAGRLGVLSLSDVLDRLGQGVLRTGTAGRHGTLYAALDWSWQLLGEPERAALAQLSVFSGGFTLEAAEAIVQTSATTLDVVGALVDRSLVHVTGAGRFDLLSSVRDYAAAQPRDLHTERRHSAYYARCGGWDRTRATTPLIDATMAANLDNLVLACERAATRGDTSVAVDALMGVCRVVQTRGPFSAALPLADRVGELALSGAQRAWIDAARGETLRLLGRLDEARATTERALATCRSAGDRQSEGRITAVLGTILRDMGEMEAALQYTSTSLAIRRGDDDDLGVAGVLGSLGGLHGELGNMDEARACYEEGLDLARRHAHRSLEGIFLGHLGVLHHQEGRVDLARSHHETALAVHREVGARRFEGVVLGNLGSLHLLQGRFDEARACYRDALAIHREVGELRYVGITRGFIGVIHHRQGDHAAARESYERALLAHREVGNRCSEATVLGYLGVLAIDVGDVDEAQRTLEASIRAHDEVGDRRNTAVMTGNLGRLHREQGRMDEARRCVMSALEGAREVRDRRGEGYWLVEMARIDQHDAETALAWLDEAEPLLEAIGDPQQLQSMHALRAALDSDAS